jgi:hypothetical protein
MFKSANDLFYEEKRAVKKMGGFMSGQKTDLEKIADMKGAIIMSYSKELIA